MSAAWPKQCNSDPVPDMPGIDEPPKIPALKSIMGSPTFKYLGRTGVVVAKTGGTVCQ
jgi:hypothetical protein